MQNICFVGMLLDSVTLCLAVLA